MMHAYNFSNRKYYGYETTSTSSDRWWLSRTSVATAFWSQSWYISRTGRIGFAATRTQYLGRRDATEYATEWGGGLAVDWATLLTTEEP